MSADRTRRAAPAEARYSVEHTGWSAAGWGEDDPTPEEAMRALAGMSSAGYPAAAAGLREAAGKQAERRREQRVPVRAEDGTPGEVPAPQTPPGTEPGES